jgi:hypothetical protein
MNSALLYCYYVIMLRCCNTEYLRAECCYAECLLSDDMLSDIVQSIARLNVVMLSVIIQSVLAPFSHSRLNYELG